MRGIVSAGILLVDEAGGYVSDYLRGDGLTKGNALVACAPGSRIPYRRRGFPGRRPITEIALDSRRRTGDNPVSRRRGAELAHRWTRSAVAWRPGDLARHQSDPLSGRRLDRDGEERVDGVRYPLGLHGFARFKIRGRNIRRPTSRG